MQDSGGCALLVGADIERDQRNAGSLLHRLECSAVRASMLLCPVQVRVRLLGGRPAVEELLVRPLGNHLVMLRGHQRALLEEWFTQFGPGTK